MRTKSTEQDDDDERRTPRNHRPDDCHRRRPGYPNARAVLNGPASAGQISTALLLHFA